MSPVSQVARQQRRGNLAANAPPNVPRYGVHSGGHAGLLLPYVLHD